MGKIKKYLIVFVFIQLLNCSIFIAQQRVLPSINLTLPVLVKTNNGGFASGFYYQDSSYTYFVTARHVLFSESTFKLLSDTLTIISNTADFNIKSKDILVLPLESMLKNNLIRFHRKFDIALIRIAKSNIKSKVPGAISIYNDIIVKQSSKAGLLTITSSSIQPYESILVSNDAFIMGYPRAIGIKNIPQIDYEEPLLKKGIIAGKNQSKRTIILDCQIYPGNSGGPVVELVRNPKENKEYFYIIGILSQYIPWINPTLKNKDLTVSNSGYSVVVPADNIFNIIEQWN